MQGIAYWIEKKAQIQPDSIAIITENEQLTYDQFNQQIKKLASYLHNHLDVSKGERIAILSQNRVEYLTLLFAIAQLEAIAVPLNIRLTVNELHFQLQDSDATILFCENEFEQTATLLKEEITIRQIIKMEAVRELNCVIKSDFSPVNESASYIICYTSGTTGQPKGAVLTQSNMFWNAINNTLALDLTSSDRSIVLLPFFHIGGIGLFALPTLFVGGTVIIPGKFDVEKALFMIEKYASTIVMGVPTIHQALLQSSTFQTRNLQSVRWFYNGGAPCPHEIIQAFIQAGFLFGQGFGMTETSPTLFMLSKHDARRKISSIGKPVAFCDYKLITSSGEEVGSGEVGEILVRGPNVMKEYWKRPDATKEAFVDGWLKTGDLARVDEEGFLYIVGRKKDMIISGGENIYPLEIEQVLNQLDEVKEAVVVGKSDNKWGEVPVAYVVKKENTALSEQAIRNHCETSLAKFKIPKEIYFLNELPKNATGKVQKNRLTMNEEMI